MTEYKCDSIGYYRELDGQKWRPLEIFEGELVVDTPTIAFKRAQLKQHVRRAKEPEPLRGHYIRGRK